MSKPKLFLSYSRTEAHLAASLSNDLSVDFVVWHDVTSIAMGDNWQESIDNALHECDALLLIVSPEIFSPDKPATKPYTAAYEWTTAIRLGKPVYLVIFVAHPLTDELKHSFVIIDFRAQYQKAVERLRFAVIYNLHTGLAKRELEPTAISRNFKVPPGIRIVMGLTLITSVYLFASAFVAQFPNDQVISLFYSGLALVLSVVSLICVWKTLRRFSNWPLAYLMIGMCGSLVPYAVGFRYPNSREDILPFVTIGLAITLSAFFHFRRSKDVYHWLRPGQTLKRPGIAT